MENNPTQPQSSGSEAEFSILGWLLKNEVKNEKGEPLVFYDRLYLLDILTENDQPVPLSLPKMIRANSGMPAGAAGCGMRLANAIRRTPSLPTHADGYPFVRAIRAMLISLFGRVVWSNAVETLAGQL